MHCFIAVKFVREVLGNRTRGTTYMAVRGGLFVDRVTQFESLLDSIRAHIEYFCYFSGYFSIGKADMRLAVSVDIEADGLGNTDSISHLHEHFISNSGGNEVFCYMASGISGGSVDFRRVFTRKSSTPMGSFSSVSIYYYLAPGESGIPVRTADNKFARRVYQ